MTTLPSRKHTKYSVLVPLGLFAILAGIFASIDLRFPTSGLLGLMDHSKYPEEFRVLTPVVDCAAGAPQILLSWTPSKGVDTYTILRNTPGAIGFSPVGEPTSEILALDRGASVPGLYTYQIQAGNVYGKTSTTLVTATVGTCGPEHGRYPLPSPLPLPEGTRNTATTSTSTRPTLTISSTTPSTVIASGTPATGTPPTSSTTSISLPRTSTTTPTPPFLGAYTGWTPASRVQFETKTERKLDHIAVVVHFGSGGDFPAYLAPYAKAEHKTPVIYWQSDEGSYAVPARYSADAILSGSRDEYFAKFAADAKAYGAPVILVPLPGANGDMHPYSGMQNGNTPATVVAAYRHIHSFFAQAPNVMFGWSVDAYSLPHTEANAPEQYYPGDDVTDIVGVFGVNTTNDWQDFEQRFGPTLSLLEQYPKPIYLFGIACQSDPREPKWIERTFTEAIPAHPRIRGIIWWNEGPKDEWNLWQNPEALAAFIKSSRTHQ